MFPSISSSLLQSSIPIPRLSAASETLFKRNHAFVFCRRDANVPEKGFRPFLLSSNRDKTFPIRPSLLQSNEILGFGNWKTTSSVPKPGFRFVCSYDAKEESERNFPEKVGFFFSLPSLSNFRRNIKIAFFFPHLIFSVNFSHFSCVFSNFYGPCEISNR